MRRRQKGLSLLSISQNYFTFVFETLPDGVKQRHGLGLPMVFRIMKVHKGECNIERNSSQKGVEMIMKIPLSRINGQ
ncbi:hypothetical protein J14TS2_37690 [Bacillus sp. J14TS2]|nr:hypothetical protein J14TS2_37690 [Bacillus sp. J14TS2]